MPIYTDQLRRQLEFTSPPKKIISLVPSQTELLYDLGLRDEVVGVTKFCIHPDEWFRSKTRVGGTKQLNFDVIKQLQPDLIIGNKEENNKEQIEYLMQHYKVWMSDIYTLKDALDMIVRLGAIVGKQQQSSVLKLQIDAEFKALSTHAGLGEKTTVAYFIWQQPYMVAGNNTFIDDMLTRCGFQNVFANSEARYPEVTSQQIEKIAPDIIFLSSEPFPFKEKHIKEFETLCPKAHVRIVDGELFSWYGSCLLKSPFYFEKLVHEIVK